MRSVDHGYICENGAGYLVGFAMEIPEKPGETSKIVAAWIKAGCRVSWGSLGDACRKYLGAPPPVQLELGGNPPPQRDWGQVSHGGAGEDPGAALERSADAAEAELTEGSAVGPPFSMPAGVYRYACAKCGAVVEGTESEELTYCPEDDCDGLLILKEKPADTQAGTPPPEGAANASEG